MAKVKICGLTRPGDAEAAVGFGAWALGMIMWRKSVRRCDPMVAAEIVATHRRQVETVGVFVDAKLDEIVETAQVAGFSMLQLHGNEGQQYAEEVARRTGCKVIKAFRVRDRSVIGELGLYRDVAFHLVDSYKAGVPGGTGETFDWSFLPHNNSDVPLILSGGLNPGNVADAIRAVSPYAVDVSSGVESEPGQKDPEKLRAFFDSVATVAATSEDEPLTGVGDEVLTLAYARRIAAEQALEQAEQAARKPPVTDEQSAETPADR